jgi:hypothetical protein
MNDRCWYVLSDRPSLRSSAIVTYIGFSTGYVPHVCHQIQHQRLVAHASFHQPPIRISTFSCKVSRDGENRRRRSRKAQQQEVVLDCARVECIRCHLVPIKTSWRRGDHTEASRFSPYHKIPFKTAFLTSSDRMRPMSSRNIIHWTMSMIFQKEVSSAPSTPIPSPNSANPRN